MTRDEINCNIGIDLYGGIYMPITEAQYRAQQKYDQKTAKRYALKFNKTTDSDIIEWLEKQESKQGVIKAALREMMKKEKEKK